MATADAFSTSTTMAGFLGVVAGIGAVCAYGYTQRDQLTRQLFGGISAERVHTRVVDEDGRRRGVEEGKGKRGRKKRKGKGGEDEGRVGAGGDGDTGGKADDTTVIPGGFDGTSAGAGLASRTASPTSSVLATTGTVPMGSDGKTRKRKKKNQGRSKGRDSDNDKDLENKEAEGEEGEDKEASSEAGNGSKIGERAAAVHRVRSRGDSDTSVSLPPSVLGSTLAPSSRLVAGKGHIRGSTTRLDVPSQPQIQVRPSLSFDTDSSWTHIDHRRIKASRSMDGMGLGSMDTVDMSSDLASTASDSPVAERANNVTDIRGEREDIPQRTLAEKLVPKPSKTGVDDMLEKPDFPTLARVMRVQPRADETPVAGFSWDDYGDVVEDSLLVHDADQEDEGEWGIVRSRSRTRPQQQTIAATLSTSHDAAGADTATKKQRQNARKRELAKTAKAEAEAVRLQGLAKHKRELERLRIIEQSRQGGGKQPSGGMQASVDDRGKLVWE